MKTIFRSLSMAAIVAGLAVTGAFAQNVCDDLDGATEKYTAFTEGYTPATLDISRNTQADIPKLKAAAAAGKGFLEKWGDCESWAEQVKFVKPWIPRVEKRIEDLEFAPTFARFDKAVEADNVDEIYAAGKLILAKYPTNHNIKYVMAVTGQQDVAKSVQAKTQSKHASEALNLAKSLHDGIKSGSIQFDRKLKDGTPSIGVLKHETNKEEALSRLGFATGYINYYGLNNKKAGVANFYEVTQMPGYFKTYSPVYATLSDYYISEAETIGNEIVKLTNEYNTMVEAVKAIKPSDEGAEAKVKQLDTDIKAKEAQIKAKEALFNGYTERAMDALARAHKIARDTTPAEKQYKQGLYTDLQRLYERRFPNKQPALNDWVASATAKPLPDPTSTVQPVTDEATTTTTTSTTGTGTGVGAANGTGIGAANGTGVGAASGTGVAPKAGVASKAKPRRR